MHTALLMCTRCLRVLNFPCSPSMELRCACTHLLPAPDCVCPRRDSSPAEESSVASLFLWEKWAYIPALCTPLHAPAADLPRDLGVACSMRRCKALTAPARMPSITCRELPIYLLALLALQPELCSIYSLLHMESLTHISL